MPMTSDSKKEIQIDDTTDNTQKNGIYQLDNQKFDTENNIVKILQTWEEYKLSCYRLWPV